MKAKTIITGRQAEAEGQPDMAITLYKKEIARGCKNFTPYQRLMVLLRKQKKYKDELAVLNKGIECLQQQLTDHKTALFIKKPQRNKILRLSKDLAKKTGLMDKKGRALFWPEPLDNWLRRKQLVRKKIQAKKLK